MNAVKIRREIIRNYFQTNEILTDNQRQLSETNEHSPSQGTADDVMRVVEYTRDGDEQQCRDASLNRGLLDDAARTDGA